MAGVVAVFFIALLIRTTYIVAFVDVGSLTAEDQMTYVVAAQTILQNGIGTVTPERGWGYPLFIAVIYETFGESNLFVIAAQAVTDSITCVLVGFLAVRVLGQGLVLAGLLSAINLNMVILSAMVLTDSLFICFFTLFLLFLVRYVDTRSCWDHFLCVSLLVVATTIRSPTYYLIPCVLLGSAIWTIRMNLPWRTMIVNILSGLLVAGFLLGPQHLRNLQKYGAYEYVSQNGATLLGWTVPGAYQYGGLGTYQGGQELAKSRLKQALAEDGLQTIPENTFIASRYMAAVAKSILAEMGWANLAEAWVTGIVVNLVSPSAAFAPVVRAMDHPSFYETAGIGVVEKLANYIGESSGLRYFLILGLGTLTSLVFLLGAATGWWLLLRGRFSDRVRTSGQLAALVFALIAAYFLLITGPIIGPKYRLPIEPMMTVLLVAAVCRWFGFRDTRFSRNSRWFHKGS